MGKHLDDIAKRNQEGAGAFTTPLAMGVAGVVAGIGADKPEPPAATPFMLASQRSKASRTPIWKVLVVMLVLGSIVSFYVWYEMTTVVARDDKAHGR